MRVGVVSDVHGSYPLLRQVVREMGPIDLLVQAGDSARDVARLLAEEDIPCRQVAGNCDFCCSLEEEARFALGRWQVLLTHGHRFGVKQSLLRLALHARQARADLVIFGHTHVPYWSEDGGIRFFNPGSLSLDRCFGRPSYGILEFTDKGIRAAIFYPGGVRVSG
ncbi:MAG: metallophosphoesterase [Bacillota bacterium]|jgi:putative phosphoesterase